MLHTNGSFDKKTQRSPTRHQIIELSQFLRVCVCVCLCVCVRWGGGLLT